ncbi:putative reverse transcriptase domain-containing protein [Tanacetum coccineum]
MYLKEVVTRHEYRFQLFGDRDPEVASNFWRSLQKALGQFRYEYAYHPQTEGQSDETIQTSEDKLRACVNSTFEMYKRDKPSKSIQVKQRMQAARDRQKSYADLKRKPMELRSVHADEPLAVPLDVLHFDDSFSFVEEPIEITDREVKQWNKAVPISQAMATKFEIEKFNGNNFSLWKLKMKAILRKDKCLVAIGERPAEVTDDSKWDEMDGNVVANLHLALADGVLSSIEEKKSAKEI